MNIYKAIYNEIKKYKKIYIARHIGPDPDAFGSQMALKDTIHETFPEKQVYAVGIMVAKFKYFGVIDKITSFDYENALLIAVDIPDNRRVDIEGFDKFKNIVKIDHHPFVDRFGEVELINEKASSTCELILELINNTKLKMTQAIAEKIFIGIVSDSNRFLVATSNKTFSLISDLVKNNNLDIEKLYKINYLKPLSEVRLMGYIASTIKVDKNGFAYIEIDEDIVKSLGADPSAASNMINDFNNINEIIVWMFISRDEKNNGYRVNIRSRGPVINELAAKYNGGGHKMASGVRTAERKDIDALIKEYAELCRVYKESGE